ncbi:MAG: chorismate synthase [Paludibacteraceae bacterium]|nr:chorismate synthase [Paludibacteraceae bacterium]
MRNSIGRNITLTLFGESHGDAVGAVLDGMPAGIEVSDTFIAEQLSKRRPSGAIETARVENDDFKILSGVFNGHTTGAPICILIPNNNTRSADYEKNCGIARPSHADYTAHIKYDGFEDYRGGGHFSGRITAGIVAAGAIAVKTLEKHNIKIGTHILSCGGVSDTDLLTEDPICTAKCIDALNTKPFPVISDISDNISAEILKAKNAQDSIGGVVQTAITGLKAGVGEPWFDSLEGAIANAVFSIGGVKGVEFGAGFNFANIKGSEANDCFCIKDGKIQTITNNNGGINGGISNGMPVIFNTAVKPTPSIAQPQQSVNMLTFQEQTLNLIGRHDPAIIRRICIVISSITAIVLCDMLSLKEGTDYLK